MVSEAPKAISMKALFGGSGRGKFDVVEDAAGVADEINTNRNPAAGVPSCRQAIATIQ